MRLDLWDALGLTMLALAIALITAGAFCTGQGDTTAAMILLGTGFLTLVAGAILGSSTFMRWRASKLWEPTKSDEAIKVAATYYGVSLVRLPRVIWAKDDPLNPFEAPGYFDETRATYVAGNWSPGALTIAHRDGFSYSKGALSVEMGNEWNYRATGIVYSEREHQPWFQDRVEGCRAALRKAGL